eukprot:11122845-Ditylum_brightwellii.AAC.1
MPQISSAGQNRQGQYGFCMQVPLTCFGAAMTVANGFEAVFNVDILLLCHGIVMVGEEMLNIWIIVIVIDFDVPNDVKAELTQFIFIGKKRCLIMVRPLSS